MKNGESKETVEESFIVIGPEFNRGQDIVERFRNDMIYFCDYFDQWAVLYISWVEPYENLDDYVRNHREDAYRVFTDPKYIDSEHIKELGNIDDPEIADAWIKREAEENYELLQLKDHLELYELYGEYLDGNGKTIKVFHNVNAGLIGNYFTTIARKAGAEKFTLMASSMRFYTHYIANNLANKYKVSWRWGYSLDTRWNIIMGGRGRLYFERTREQYNKYISGETEWLGEHYGKRRKTEPHRSL